MEVWLRKNSSLLTMESLSSMACPKATYSTCPW